MEAAVQRPDTEEKGGHTFVLDSDALIKTVDLGSVTVPADKALYVRAVGEEAAQIRDLTCRQLDALVGQPVGKLELLDDPDWTGRYALSFQVNNLTNIMAYAPS